MSLERDTFFVDNGAGWRLPIQRFRFPEALDPSRRPVVFVPGFAMNSFILGHHPRGDSIAAHLARQGFEVWTCDMRSYGLSESIGGNRDFGLTQVGVEDVGAVIEGILARTEVLADGVDAIGCSLGATYVFIHHCWAQNSQIRRIINLGGPLRWTAVHGLFRALASTPKLWRLARMRGTRRIAKVGLPLAAKIPGFLHLYLHPAICDLSEPSTLVQTVEDPIPRVNEEVARWVKLGDLIDAGRNLTEDMRACTLPLMTVVANADGIVPEATTCSAHNVVASTDRRLIYAGDEHTPMAHADLFMSDPAPARVFEPLADWLRG